jgi:hypothetical protein
MKTLMQEAAAIAAVHVYILLLRHRTTFDMTSFDMTFSSSPISTFEEASFMHVF